MRENCYVRFDEGEQDFVLWQILNGHEAGNGGDSQGPTYQTLALVLCSTWTTPQCRKVDVPFYRASNHSAQALPEPYPAIEGMRNVQRLLKTQNPRIGEVNIDDLVDNRYIRKLDESGFSIESMANKQSLTRILELQI
jgi:hypothetical protein